MAKDRPASIQGVLLSEVIDLQAVYGLDFEDEALDVTMSNPEDVVDPASIRLAVCWRPGRADFEPYKNLEVVMSIGAGVEDLLAHPGLNETIIICRVRDQDQATLMAGYVLHEVLHVQRNVVRTARSQADRRWDPFPMIAPCDLTVAVLGNGTMGSVICRALRALGFSVRAACTAEPSDPLEGVQYLTGAGAIEAAATGSDFLVNVLPLTCRTQGVLNRDLFARLKSGAWLVQVGRGEHLNETDFFDALDIGQLAGASLDVFRDEPLPREHPFWSDLRLRISPHIASDTTPKTVSKQVLQTAREMIMRVPLSLAVDRLRGY